MRLGPSERALAVARGLIRTQRSSEIAVVEGYLRLQPVKTSPIGFRSTVRTCCGGVGVNLLRNCSPGLSTPWLGLAPGGERSDRGALALSLAK